MPSPTDSRLAGPPALREVLIGRSTGLAQASEQSKSPLPVLWWLQVRSPQIPGTHRNNYGVEFLSVLHTRPGVTIL